jgi:hypothetical protein
MSDEQPSGESTTHEGYEAPAIVNLSREDGTAMTAAQVGPDNFSLTNVLQGIP